MFLNCPHCGALIAADPVSELSPPCCPRCGKALPEPAPEPVAAPEAPPDAPTTPAAVATTAPAAAETPQAPEADAATAEATVVGMADGLPCPLEPSQPAVDLPPSTAGEDAPAARADSAAPPEARPGDRKKAARTRKRVDKAPASGTAPAADGTGVDRAPHAPAQDAGDRAAEPAIAAAPSDHAPLPPAAAATAVATPTLPRFARVRARTTTADGPRRWLLPSLIAGLSLLLALQWMLADRARLAADARWRPFVVELCGVLRCNLPAWREPSAFVLMDRDVRPHPAMPGVLRVSATFRNDARWAQPWPELVLTLSDVDGRAAGTRAFKADEYLGNVPTQKVLASGQTATVRLEILEPTPHVVAFAFDFR